VGKSEVKRPLLKPRLRWKNNIKMDLQEVGWVHGLLLGLNKGVPSGSMKCGEFIDGLKSYQLLKKDCAMEIVN
jgi:hypothetical protein